MALKGILVPLPTSKTVIRPSGKYKYVYYIRRSYRNDKNQPTSDTVCIGRLDSNPNMMIPNEKYFDYFQVEPLKYNREVKSILNYGTYYVLDEVASKIGIKDILINIFPDDYYKILLCSYYVLCEGNVLSYIDDWCETTYNDKEIYLTSQTTSKLISSITDDLKISFFKEWAKKRSENEYIAYDVTSISSYSTNLDAVEWGYNRDNEELPQINLGMFYGETSRLPIYYNSYYGSITDKEHLVYMMENTKLLGINNVKFVMDKGFYKKANLNYMVKNNYPFIICLSNSSKYTKAIINEVKDKLNSSRYLLNNDNYYGIIVPKSQAEILYNIHVIYNEEKVADENSILFNRIKTYEQELSMMTTLPEKYNKYNKYFKISINKDQTFDYERDYEKIDYEKNLSGYIVFLTTDLNITTSELLKIYRNKDIIEKAFDNLKNELDLKRMRIHSDTAWSGKMFISFISLILRSYIENSKRNNEEIKSLTVKKIIKELEKIKLVTYYDEDKLLNPITAKQKKIFKALDISYENMFKVGH